MYDSSDLSEIQRGAITIEEIAVGMERRLKKVIGDADIEMFGELSTDKNPVHFCDDYAGGTVFKGRIAHGMLTAGLISAVIGEQLPGHGSIYLKQSLTFLAPVRPGDEVETIVTVADVDREKRRVALDCRCLVGDTTVLKGEALALAPASR